MVLVIVLILVMIELNKGFILFFLVIREIMDVNILEGNVRFRKI